MTQAGRTEQSRAGVAEIGFKPVWSLTEHALTGAGLQVALCEQGCDG